MRINYMNSNDKMNYALQFNDKYEYLKGYLNGKNFFETIHCLDVGKKFHANQYRLNGELYFIHPINTTLNIINAGMSDEITLQAALLHDVLEENNVSKKDLLTEHYIRKEVLDIISLLTKRKGLSNEELKNYFKNISRNKSATIIKLADRIDNLSTLYLFHDARREKYIFETENFILNQLLENAFINFPEIYTILSGYKVTIESILENVLYIQEENLNEKNILISQILSGIEMNDFGNISNKENVKKIMTSIINKANEYDSTK